MTRKKIKERNIHLDLEMRMEDGHPRYYLTTPCEYAPIGSSLSEDYARWTRLECAGITEMSGWIVELTDDFDATRFAEVSRRTLDPGDYTPRVMVDVVHVELTPGLLQYLRS